MKYSYNWLKELSGTKKTMLSLTTELILLFIIIFVYPVILWGSEVFWFNFMWGLWILYIPILAFLVVDIIFRVIRILRLQNGWKNLGIVMICNVIIAITIMIILWAFPCSQIRLLTFKFELSKITTNNNFSKKETCLVTLVENRYHSLKNKRKKQLNYLDWYMSKSRANEILNDIDNNKKLNESLKIINSSLIVAKRCLANEGYLITPQSGKSVCEYRDVRSNKKYKNYRWYNIEKLGGKWGGCNFYVEKDSLKKDTNLKFDLQYCVTLSSGEIIKCTINGCSNESLNINNKKTNDINNCQDGLLTVINETVSRAIICNDANENNLVKPQSNKLLCNGGISDYKWPKIEDCKAEWDGCNFEKRFDGNNFRYCAKSINNIIECTQAGCYKK